MGSSVAPAVLWQLPLSLWQGLCLRGSGWQLAAKVLVTAAWPSEAKEKTALSPGPVPCGPAVTMADRPSLNHLWAYSSLFLKDKACVCAWSCPTLCDPVDCSPPGPSVHGTCQARILEWIAMPSSKGSSLPRDRTQVSRIEPETLMSPASAGGFFTTSATWEARDKACSQ